VSTFSFYLSQAEVVQYLEPYVEETILPRLDTRRRRRHHHHHHRQEQHQEHEEEGATGLSPRPASPERGALWQPVDLLPDSLNPDFVAQVSNLRREAEQLDPSLVDMVVALMVNKQLVPAYLSRFNALDGARDETGASTDGYASMNRAWAAIENRHADVLKRWCYLSGVVPMRQIEVHIHALITLGMTTTASTTASVPATGSNTTCFPPQAISSPNSPYLGLLSATFQEKWHADVFHKVAALAKAQGCETLAEICRRVGEDDKLQEVCFSEIVSRIFAADPDGGLISLAAGFADGSLGRLGSIQSLIDGGVAAGKEEEEEEEEEENAEGKGRQDDESNDSISDADHVTRNTSCGDHLGDRVIVGEIQLGASLAWIRQMNMALYRTLGVRRPGDIGDLRSLMARWKVEELPVSTGFGGRAQDYLLEVEADA